MLFAVEGGGFFSSSASGYSKGLALLLLDTKHRRATPWNQYQLVDRERESDFQLASVKNRPSRGCVAFVCFGRASAGLDGQSPLKVGPTQPHEILHSVPATEKDEELSSIVDYDIVERHMSLRSSMKKSSQNIPKSSVNNDEQEPLVEEVSIPEGLTEKRKVQWTDACGKELAEIREFEMSERGESDDEFTNGKTCSCRIM